MKLVIATNNQHKLTEFKRMLDVYFDDIYSLKDVGIVSDAQETGATFLDNARIKANAVADEMKKKYGDDVLSEYAVLADDSGLCVDALNGEPGVRSARYASENEKDATDAQNRAKLLFNMKNKENRTARFTSALVLLTADREYTVEGHTEGTIIYEERGKNGFGYDSIFMSSVLGKTFGEVSDEEKDRVSHRGAATENLIKIFDNKFCKNR